MTSTVHFTNNIHNILIMFTYFLLNFQLRTRTSLLHSLCEELKDKTKDFLGHNGDSGSASGLSTEPTKLTASSSSSSECSNGTISGAGSRFIDTVRKALIARVKTQTLSNSEANNNISGGLSKKTSSCSADGSIPSVSLKNKFRKIVIQF